MDVLDFLDIKSDTERKIVLYEKSIDQEIERVLLIKDVISNQLNGLTGIYKDIKDYDEIDFKEAQFKLEYWTISRLLKLQFPNWSKEKYEKDISKSTINSFEEWDELFPLPCRKQRIDYWKTNGTWYIPIILIKISDFIDCGLKEHYQLFEGHTRLSRLKIINKHKNCRLNERHLVFIIQK